MSAAEHLQEAVNVGCTRDDHDHVADHRAEVLAEAAEAVDNLRWEASPNRVTTLESAWYDGLDAVVQLLHRMADTGNPGKDTGDAVQAPAGESTQTAVGTCGRALSTGQPCHDHPFVPHTEREHWVDIADALNAAGAAGMAVGIDMEGILTDHIAWAVVWNRSDERWEVGGYEDDSPAETPGDAEDWVICCSPDPRCPNGERRDRAVERGWTQNGRAGNWLCATHSPSDFFRPGRTYARPSHGRTVEFRVTHISTPPGGGEPMAFGWHRVSGYDAWRDHSDDDFAVWTEVVEAGESRG